MQLYNKCSESAAIYFIAMVIFTMAMKSREMHLSGYILKLIGRRII